MRNIVVVAAGLGLAGCSSFSMPDMFKSTPPVVTVQFESVPPGAEARVSSGESCKTPCSLALSVEKEFTTTFSLPKYQPETVTAQAIRDPSGPGAIVDPNPVYAELQPAAPPRGHRAAPKAKRPRAAPPPAAALGPAENTSPFPPPPGR
jgi:hypothetical protein